MDLPLKEIELAAKRLENTIHRTKIERSKTFSDMSGAEVYLKYENQQKTGSFKIRGASNKIAALVERGELKAAVASSAGNHAQGVAFAAKKYGVKATFFVTNEDPDYQDMIAKEAEAGHTVAIHSASHDYPKIYQSTDAYMADLYEMNDIIKAQTGKSASIIRFPGGASNTVSADYCKGIMTQLVSLVEASGFQYCDWNVSSGDAGETKDTNQVVENVVSGIQKHKVSVVLQHDIKGFSVNAVERIIQWGLSEGYTFLPLTTSSPMVHHGINN